MVVKRLTALLVVFAVLGLAPLAHAQSTPDYDFVKKVKDRNYQGVTLMVLDHTNVNARDVDGTTALMVAVENGDGAMVSLLLNAGADPNILDRKSGEVPLTMAAARNNGDVVERLLKGRADPDATNKRYETALIKAVNFGNRPIIRLLMSAGADPKAQDFTGHDALWYATNARNRDLLALLQPPAGKPAP